jgi:hypothetical protein
LLTGGRCSQVVVRSGLTVQQNKKNIYMFQHLYFLLSMFSLEIHVIR